MAERWLVGMGTAIVLAVCDLASERPTTIGCLADIWSFAGASPLSGTIYALLLLDSLDATMTSQRARVGKSLLASFTYMWTLASTGCSAGDPDAG